MHADLRLVADDAPLDEGADSAALLVPEDYDVLHL